MNITPGFQSGFHSGISGLQLPIPRYLYPPPYENASRLTYYSSLFNSIEINSSFYKIPQAATVAKWAGSVPDDFRFTFKLWKEITHSKGFNFREVDVILFFNSINAVLEKKGCLLIQLPPSLGREYTVQLDKLLTIIKVMNTAPGWKIAVEFRNKSWYHEDVYDILKFYNVAMVIQDIRKSSTPLFSYKSDFMYIRFHGPHGNYRDSYTDEFLNEYANYLNDWVKEGRNVFVYFNNTMGDAFNNSQTLTSLLQHKIKITNP